METELFVHFAEIAGVFVGFGALISVRSAQPSDAHDVVYLRAVLGIGLWVVIAALLAIALNRYGISDPTLWRASAAVSLALWAALVVALNRGPESRALNSSPEPLDRVFPVVGLPLHILGVGSLLIIVLGVRPGIDEALYVTALTTGVVFAGYTLLALAFSQKPTSEGGRPRG
jgi:hypothetical protein